MPRTERMRTTCTVKERHEGEPYLVFEPLEHELSSIFEDNNFGLDLEPGTTLEEARELAGQINGRARVLRAHIS